MQQPGRDIELVAESIAKAVRPALEAKRFPEAFLPAESARQTFSLSGFPDLIVEAWPFLSEVKLVVSEGERGLVVCEATIAREIAESIVIALLLGRRDFEAPVETACARAAISEFRQWFADIQARIDEGCRSSALGTRYEEVVRRVVAARLNLDPRLALGEILGRIEMQATRE